MVISEEITKPNGAFEYHMRDLIEEDAEEIAKILNADSDEIIDKKSRKGIIGWLSSGRDAFKKELTKIENKKDPSGYDLVIIGTPIWAGTMTPAVRTYLSNKKFKTVAFFCTYAESQGKCFEQMQELSGKPKAILTLKDKKIDESKSQIKDFCDRLKR